MNFKQTIANNPFIITEGAIVERMRRNPDIHLDPHIVCAGLIYDTEARKTLAQIYKEYLDIGQTYNLPILLGTSTRRADFIALKRAGYGPEQDVNGDFLRFLADIREEYGVYKEKIFIGGLTGCQGDCYKPEESLSAKEAIIIHRPQIKALADAGADYLIAATMPATEEATGIAIAMSECDLPYIISFVIQANGTLLDGIPIHEAITRIDQATNPKPFCYMVNCVHPSIFSAAMTIERDRAPWITDRLLGIQANTSSKSPKELDNLPYLDTEAPETMAQSMFSLYKDFGTKIIGGCCGTNNLHIECIAKLFPHSR